MLLFAFLYSFMRPGLVPNLCLPTLLINVSPVCLGFYLYFSIFVCIPGLFLIYACLLYQ